MYFWYSVINSGKNSFSTFFWIMKRFAALQACPQFCSLAFAPIFAASFKSESSKTIKASLPPSSSRDFLMFFPAMDAISAPAFSLPVKLTPLIIGFSNTDFTSAWPISRFWKTPFGNPASANSFSIIFPLPKQIEACFRTTVFPAKIAGTANLRTCQNGKFQGITPKITPKGA